MLPVHAVKDISGTIFKQPFKSKKGYYKDPVLLDAKMVNVCRIYWHKYRRGETYYSQEEKHLRMVDNYPIFVLGYTDTEYRCRMSGAYFNLPFHCVEICKEQQSDFDFSTILKDLPK